MSQNHMLSETIHKANIEVHRAEARYYKLFHPEIYGKKEQKRITKALKQADTLVSDNGKHALDFGAGIGNLTDKLLALGYTVTAVDISAEMCKVLRSNHIDEVKSGKLTVIESPIEDLDFKTPFDLVTCCSVLHHLPDYKSALKKLCSYVKQGGVMFLDHEVSPYFWWSEATMFSQAIRSANYHSNPLLNTIYFRVVGLNLPQLDYTISDYWFKPERHVDHAQIKHIFTQQGFSSFQRTDYYSHGSWIMNPISLIYRYVCRPDMSCWIAKK